MQSNLRKSALSLALAACAFGTSAWSPASHACASDPYLTAVCIMANSSSYGPFGNTYVLASGQQLTVNQYQVLYAIMGNTFGGTSGVNFNLPDLRGRVVMGSGVSPVSGKNYSAGQKGGAEAGTITAAITLTAANLPAHSHTLNALPTKGVTVATGLGNLVAATTLTGLTTTTSLANIPFASSSSNLSMVASNSTPATANPTSGSTLATVNAGMSTVKMYGSGTPDTTLKVGTVTGTVSGTLSGTAPGTVSGGTATTTFTGATTAVVSGTTDPAGSTTPSPVPVTGTVSTMPPYLVMNYYIAVSNGLFPQRD